MEVFQEPLNEKDFLPWLKNLTPKQLKILFQDMDLNLPLETWEKLESVIKSMTHKVSARHADGSRATTVDNFKEWFDVLLSEKMRDFDTPFSLIPVSSQPFVMHQAAAATGPWINSFLNKPKTYLFMKGIGIEGQKKHDLSTLFQDKLRAALIVLSLQSIAQVMDETLNNIEALTAKASQ